LNYNKFTKDTQKTTSSKTKPKPKPQASIYDYDSVINENDDDECSISISDEKVNLLKRSEISNKNDLNNLNKMEYFAKISNYKSKVKCFTSMGDLIHDNEIFKSKIVNGVGMNNNDPNNTRYFSNNNLYNVNHQMHIMKNFANMQIDE